MLSKIIHENLNPPARTVRPLRGGLILIFYPREATYLRIIAARRGVEPSDKELVILRREIVAAVAEQPLVAVGNFERKLVRDGYHAAEIWINFPPVREAESS
mgnify:CR=1 FL=1